MRFTRAAFAGLTPLLLLAGQASGAALAVRQDTAAEPRTAFVSDVDGDFTSIFKLNDGCPDSVKVSGTTGVNGGVGKTPVANIEFNGEACEGGTMFSVSESIARDDASLGLAGLDAFAENLKSNPTALTAVSQPGTTEVLVGNDVEGARTCGGATWGLDTFYLFIKEGEEQEIKINTPTGTQGGTIPVGSKGLFIISNDGRLCLLTAAATKIPGEDTSAAAGGTGVATGSPVPADSETGTDADPTPEATDDVADATAAGATPGAVDDEDGKAGASSDDDDDGSACFPAEATVVVKGGRVVRMSEVQIGDEVMVGPGQFSKVFMFTHKVADASFAFVTLETASGHKVSMTKGHYLYVDGALVAASQVKVGSTVTLGSGEADAVVRVGKTVASGLYNPQTVQGNVVVDGVLSSTYTTAVEPAFAHAVLAPLRFFNALGLHFTALESGGGSLAEVAPRGLRTEL